MGIVSIGRSGGATGGGSIAYGGVTVLIAVGLLAEWEWASIVLKWYCGISIFLFAGVTLLFLGVAMSGLALGWLGVAFMALFIGLYAFMIYLVNEVGQA